MTVTVNFSDRDIMYLVAVLRAVDPCRIHNGELEKRLAEAAKEAAQREAVTKERPVEP